MARVIAQVANTNSFEQWVAKTNELAALFAETVTIAANATGDSTTGNGFISGVFGGTTLVATNLRGGTVTTAAVLTITSNVAATGSRLQVTANVDVVAANVSFSSNSSVEAIRIVGNSTATSTTVGGTSAAISANLTLTGRAFVVPTGNTSVRPTSPSAGTFRYNSEISSLEVYTSAWEIVTSSANSTVAASAVIFANTADISSTTVQNAIVETYNEKVSKSGDSMTGDLIINKSGSTAQTAPTGTVNQAINADGTPTLILSDSIAAPAVFAGRRSNGTAGARTTVANNDVIAAIYAFGHDGNSYQTTTRGGLEVRAGQAWTNTAHGTALVGTVTPSNSNAAIEILRFTSALAYVNTAFQVAGLTTTNTANVLSTFNVVGNSSFANVSASYIVASANVSAPVFLANSIDVRRAANSTADGVARFATASEYRTGTDTSTALQTKLVWDSAAEVTLAYSSTTIGTSGDGTSLNMSKFFNAVMTLTQNSTLGGPSNVKVGQTGCIRIVQDSTGSRTLSFHADWEFSNGSAPTLTTTANAQDLLFYRVLASGRVYANLARNVS